MPPKKSQNQEKRKRLPCRIDELTTFKVGLVNVILEGDSNHKLLMHIDDSKGFHQDIASAVENRVGQKYRGNFSKEKMRRLLTPLSYLALSDLGDPEEDNEGRKFFHNSEGKEGGDTATVFYRPLALKSYGGRTNRETEYDALNIEHYSHTGAFEKKMRVLDANFKTCELTYNESNASLGGLSLSGENKKYQVVVELLGVGYHKTNKSYYMVSYNSNLLNVVGGVYTLKNGGD